MKINEERITKMKDGRLKHLKENNGLICKLNGGIEIWADKFQYILRIKGSPDSYHSSLESSLESLIDFEQKKYLIVNQQKNIKGVLDALRNFRQWVEELLKPLDTQSAIDKIIRKS